MSKLPAKGDSVKDANDMLPGESYIFWGPDVFWNELPEYFTGEYVGARDVLHKNDCVIRTNLTLSDGASKTTEQIFPGDIVGSQVKIWEAL